MSAPPDELPGRTRPPVHSVRLALALVIVVVAALLLLPDLLGLDHRGPFAQLVSFRPPWSPACWYSPSPRWSSP